MESLFTITQNWKQLQYPSTAEWIKKKKKVQRNTTQQMEKTNIFSNMGIS